MHRLLLLGIVVFLAATRCRNTREFDHSVFDSVLKKFVSETGRVDYAALKADRAGLDRYAALIAAQSPVSHPGSFPTSASRLAYWINAYNALMIKCVVDHWPVRSVQEIGPGPMGVFSTVKFIAGGREDTLNGIEQGILRKDFSEPRIHFALVCASEGCPRLQRQAFTAANTEGLLEAGARFFLNEPRNLKIDAASDRVTVSGILLFYKSDFEKSGLTVFTFIKNYASEENRKALDALKNPTLAAFEYDWGVNAK